MCGPGVRAGTGGAAADCVPAGVAFASGKRARERASRAACRCQLAGPSAAASLLLIPSSVAPLFCSQSPADIFGLCPSPGLLLYPVAELLMEQW